jgi:lysozyme
MVETLEGCAKRSQGIVKASLETADRLVTVPMTYGQWVAYGDFIGNAGESNFRKSSMLRYANKGDLKRSCDAFRLWVYAGGRDCRKPESNCRGIVARRELERSYCLGIIGG